MIRLFVNADLCLGQKVLLPVKQAHYVCHVMRLKDGEELAVLNGRQGLWSAQVVLEKKQVFLKLLKQLLPQQNLPRRILCPALIKKEAMDLVLQKATELGATEIYPILAERSVVNHLNMERAQNIIQEACEQCERLDAPQLFAPKKLEEVILLLKGQADLIWLSERGKNGGQKTALVPAFFVGPEGGWSPKEQELFRKSKAIEWHLGHTILRAETASIAALSLCLLEN